MKNLVVYIVLLIVLPIHAQEITGTLVTNQSQPIPYATVQIGDNFGVISNDEGVFVINTEGFAKDSMVTISCLGFKKLEMPLETFKSRDYILEEDIQELSEVFISSRNLTAAEILNNIRQSISKNYTNNPLQQEVFMRVKNTFNVKDLKFEIAKSSLFKRKQLKGFNAEFKDVIANNLNKESSSYLEALTAYYSFKENSKVNAQKVIKLINKKTDKSTNTITNNLVSAISKHLDTSSTYKVRSGLFKVDDSLKLNKNIVDIEHPKTIGSSYINSSIASLVKQNTLHENSKLNFLFEEKKYNYIIKGVTNFNNQNVYIIAFYPKKKSAKYAGKFYVNVEDYAVVKIDYQFEKGKAGKKVNLKLLVGIKFAHNQFKTTVIYKKNETNTYSLNFIGSYQNNYVYISRPLKFIKNRVNKDEEKQTLKLKMLLEQDQGDKTELFFTNTSSITETAYTKAKQPKEFPLNYIPKFTPQTWKGYNIIAPVNDILEYNTGEE